MQTLKEKTVYFSFP